MAGGKDPSIVFKGSPVQVPSWPLEVCLGILQGPQISLSRTQLGWVRKLEKKNKKTRTFMTCRDFVFFFEIEAQ